MINVTAIHNPCLSGSIICFRSDISYPFAFKVKKQTTYCANKQYTDSMKNQLLLSLIECKLDLVPLAIKKCDIFGNVPAQNEADIDIRVHFVVLHQTGLLRQA